MAIQFARIRIIGRKDGGNACRSAAYNSRGIVSDYNSNVTFNFSNRPDNVHHEVLLPEGVDAKFKEAAALARLVESAEKRKDSQLLKEIVLALPDNPEITLEDHKALVRGFIDELGYVKEGLGVQVDIHKPDEDNKNWHAHLLITTRRFKENGLELEDKKATDLNPDFVKVKGKPYVVREEQMIHDKWAAHMDQYFNDKGLEIRVDPISLLPGEHVGPRRFRANSEKKDLNLEKERAMAALIKSGEDLLAFVTIKHAVFNKNDLARHLKFVPANQHKRLIAEALSSKELIPLLSPTGLPVETGYYTTKKVRAEERALERLLHRIGRSGNVHRRARLASLTRSAATKHGLSELQDQALQHLLLKESGLRILRGRAGVGKSRVLKALGDVAAGAGINAIAVAPTHKAASHLSEAFGVEQIHTVKGLLFKIYSGKLTLSEHSLLVVDEAGMVGDEDLAELARLSLRTKSNLILSLDERQLQAINRGGMSDHLSQTMDSFVLEEVRRQTNPTLKEVSGHLARGEVESAIQILHDSGAIKFCLGEEDAHRSLVEDFLRDPLPMKDKLIVAVSNREVDQVNELICEHLLLNGHLSPDSVTIRLEGQKRTFYAGQRVLIKATNKVLGLQNGDFGDLVKVSQKRFTVKLDRTGKEVSVNPEAFPHVASGYASTVCKAQGASILGVFALHSGFGTLANAYVALTRGIEKLRLYANKDRTRTLKELVRQLSNNPRHEASLRYPTKKELDAEMKADEARRQENDNRLRRSWLGNFAVDVKSKVKTSLQEWRDEKMNVAYYDFQAPEESLAEVEEVLELVHDAALEDSVHDVGLLDGHNQVIGRQKISYGNRGGRSYSQRQGGRGTKMSQDQQEFANIGQTQKKEPSEFKEQPEKQHEMPAEKQSKAQELEGQKTFKEKQNIGAKDQPEAQAKKHAMAGEKFTQTELKVIAKGSSTPKQKFYSKADKWRSSREEREKSWDNLRKTWREEAEQLRSSLELNSELVAQRLLGAPNKKLSNNRTLRYGNKGSLAISIVGKTSGTWHDFSTGQGGDMLSLIQDQRRCDFKEAASLAKEWLNLSKQKANSYDDIQLQERYTKNIENKEREQKDLAQKQAKVRNLQKRAKPLTKKALAAQYLQEARGLGAAMLEHLPEDLKTAGAWQHALQKNMPTLLAFARNSEGEITGGQQIILDPETKDKAKLEVNKRSFGQIKGAFVTLHKDVAESSLEKGVKTEGKEALEPTNLTIIAEGLETALSIKSALLARAPDKLKNTQILCSLGINNIKNYQPKSGENILIAADNDGPEARSRWVVEDAKAELLAKASGVAINIVQPKEVGDFNDYMQKLGHPEGAKAIEKIINPVAQHLKAPTIEALFKENGQALDDAESKEHLHLLRQYGLKEQEQEILSRLKDEHGDALPISAAWHLGVAKQSLTLSQTALATKEAKSLIAKARAFEQAPDLQLSLKGAKEKENEKEREPSLLSEEALLRELCRLPRAEAEARLRYIETLPHNALRMQLNAKVAELRQAIKQEKDLSKAWDLKVQEQQLLVHYYPELSKGHKAAPDNLLHEASRATLGVRDGALQGAHSTMQHMQQTGMPEKPLLKAVKESHDGPNLHDNIKILAREHYNQMLTQHLREFRAGKTVTLGEHSFSCPHKYMQHVEEHFEHHLPEKHLEHHRQQAMQIHRERSFDFHMSM